MPIVEAAHISLNRFVETEITVRLDPLLQRIVARRSRGILAEATASSGVDEVPVIAKVTEPTAWRA